MKTRKTKLILSLALVVLVMGCCTKVPEETKWHYSEVDVTGTENTKTDKIDIDVYVDATTSMAGFATGTGSNYSNFLDNLEANALSVWKNSDVRYFKFGSFIKPVDRAEFLKSKSDVGFYRDNSRNNKKDRPLFEKTYIDSVVNRTDAMRLSVVVTDLFQDEGDVNIMVHAIKEKCFTKNVMVGIIGVKSDFDGTVFDVPKGHYKLKAENRPFYALLFGNPYNMELLFDAMKTKPYIKENQFLLFSRHIIKSQTVELIKTKESRFVNKKAPKQEVKNSFDFSMKEKGKEASFTLEVDLSRNGHCADFVPENLELVAYKNAAEVESARSDSIPTKDLSMADVRREGDKLKATLLLKNEDGKGNYSYMVLVRANPITGLVVPKWVKGFSTDNPQEGTASASLTYNLEKLTDQLIRANASVNPTYVAKFYLNIYKR